MKLLNFHSFERKLFLFALTQSRERQTKGFTLIELLVVIIIMGILMAVAVPTLLGQVGKSREAEVLNQLGAISRTQQARHFQKGKFASTMAQIEAESGVIVLKHYDVNNITTDPSESLWVKIKAIPFNGPKDQVRNFAVGIYFNVGAFERATCRGDYVGVDVEVGNTASDPCTNNGTKLY